MQEQRDLWKLEQTSTQHTGTQSPKSLSALLQELGPNGQKLLAADEIDTINKTGQVTIGSRTIVFGLPDEEDDLEIGDVVEATGLTKFKDSSNNDIEWIYFGKEGNNRLVTTAKPLDETFTVNEQPDNEDTKRIENSAKNWLYFDLKDTDTGYTDSECTVTNNINKFCAKLYSDNGGTVGKARSITLEDIYRVIGFKAPSFSKYNFGTTNDCSDTSVTGNHTVDFYYPTLDAKNQTTSISTNPKVYKYWKKALGTSDTKEFMSASYNLSNDNGVYKLTWNDSERGWTTESLSATSTWKLEALENMRYVVGESSDYLYVIGSKAIDIGEANANFGVSCIFYGSIFSPYFELFGISYSDHVFGNYSYSISVRPIVSLESEVQLNKVQ